MAAIKESNVLDGRPARAEAKSGSCFYFLEQLGSIWNTLLHPNLAGLLRKWGLPSSSNDEDSAWQLHPILRRIMQPNTWAPQTVWLHRRRTEAMGLGIFPCPRASEGWGGLRALD